MMFKTKLPLFPMNIVLVTSMKDFDNNDLKYLNVDTDIKCHGMSISRIDDKHSYMILVKKKREKGEVISTISHECFHCITDVLDAVGVKTERGNSETAAYLMGWLVKWCYESIYKTN